MNRKPYPTDLSDEQWKLLEPMLPPPEQFGRKRSVNLREIFNALLYVLRSGGAWRMLPSEFPGGTTVYYYFQKWRNVDWFVAINDRLRRQLREQQGRDENASAAVLNSQSVKTMEEGYRERGFDAGKKINGRKRHLLVDTLGLLLAVTRSRGERPRPRSGKTIIEDVSRAISPSFFNLGGRRLSRQTNKMGST